MPAAARKMLARVYRIRTPRLVLRCWEPRDVHGMVESIRVSLKTLAPWMPWAEREPLTVEAKLKLIQQWRAHFDRGETFAYCILPPDESCVWGAIGSHDRIGAGAREIGYWIRGDQVRQGLATEAAAAMTRAGFELQNLRRMEIHCSPLNVASAGVPRKLGFEHALTISGCVLQPKMDRREDMIWVMLRSRYPRSPAAATPYEAFNAIGEAMHPAPPAPVPAGGPLTSDLRPLISSPSPTPPDTAPSAVTA